MSSGTRTCGRLCGAKGFGRLDRLAQQYLGKPYPRRDRHRFSTWIEIDTWHGWGTLKDNSQVG
ncbi:hypothetical protein [Streptosporangium roseum]|uniref:hypothetical protein n=1 Tax=Streptosporangium roseum TaxID=2001 RepID=UPI0001A3A48A|nr:hypothetical protein [Streptosporangium roseum]